MTEWEREYRAKFVGNQMNKDLGKVQIPIDMRVDRRSMIERHDSHDVEVRALGTFNMNDLKRFLIPVIMEAFKEVSAKFEPQDMYNPNFMNLLLSEFNTLKAIVDNEIVTQGYTYPNGIVVQEIGRDGVTFKVGDNLIPVTMEEL